MSSYNISISDDGTGVFTPTIARGGTAYSGGTALTVPVQWNYDGSYGTTKTRHLDDAFMVAMKAALADRASGN